MLILAALLLAFVAAPAFAQVPSPPKSAPAPAPKLQVTDVLFEDYNGDASSRWQSNPGQEVVVTFRVDGFGRQEVEDEDGRTVHRVALDYHVAMKDASGNEVVPAYEEHLDTTLGPRDQNWKPKVNWSATVPQGAVGGDYTVEIRVKDLIAKNEVTREANFRVAGAAVADAATFAVQQLLFANSEQGPWSPERYFALSDTIFVQYRVVGYRVSPEHRITVEQDWQVLDADGKVLVSQPNAVVENTAEFYPPRFLFTTFSLKLDNPKPGQYALRVDLRDLVGEQMTSFEAPFFIRQ